MSISQYYLNWDSHKSNICNGFANLQQNEEFVDMTLAADGHLVNVHKMVFALASPYIKTMIQSAPTPHPVVFLSNLSHEVLNYILTYVYTGEVSVEVDKMEAFMRAAKELQLSGLSSLISPKVAPEHKFKSTDIHENEHRNNIINSVPERVTNEPLINNMHVNTTVGTKPILTNNSHLDKSEQYAASNDVQPMKHINISTVSEGIVTEKLTNNVVNGHDGLYTTPDGYQFKLEIPKLFNKPQEILETPAANNSATNIFKSMDMSYDDESVIDQVNMPKIEILHASLPNNADKIDVISKSIPGTLDPKVLIPEYTMSSRGSLQLILNRYMYYCHHQSQGGRKRRWRCIDYRKSQCPAFIDTIFEVMTIRKFVHVHPFHDDKIFKKKRMDLVFTNLNSVLHKRNTFKLNETASSTETHIDSQKQ